MSALKTAAQLNAPAVQLYPDAEIMHPDRRRLIVEELHAEGFFSSEHEAQEFVMQLWDRAEGKPFSPVMRNALAETERAIALSRAARSHFADAKGAQGETSAIAQERDRVAADLAWEEQKLAQVQVMEERVLANYLSAIVRERKPYHAATDFFSRVLAEREQEKFIRERAIPELKRQLANLNSRLKAATS